MNFIQIIFAWVARECNGYSVGLAIGRSRVQILYSRQRCVTTLGKLFTPMCLCHQAVQLGTGQRAVMLCGWAGNRRPMAESNGSLPPGGWLTVTCGLTACTPGSAPGPTLSIEYGKAFTLPVCTEEGGNWLKQMETQRNDSASARL